MRCFVALDLPRPVCNHLANVTAPLDERFDLKWVPVDNMHVTLLFAGDIYDDGVDALCDVISACDEPPREFTLTGFGTFPPKGMPHVVWAGLGDGGGGDIEATRSLQKDISAVAESFDVPREKRRFSPHVTIARTKSQFGALALIDRLKELSKELKQKPFPIESITVYQSTLTPRGPRYDVLHRRSLG
ncbi:MAG: RNA 2',3'-cyclic phosphodiesterase [Planctomycetota bacterium]